MTDLTAVRAVITDFAAWLTTRDEAITLGAKHPSPVVIPLIDEYLQLIAHRNPEAVPAVVTGMGYRIVRLVDDVTVNAATGLHKLPKGTVAKVLRTTKPDGVWGPGGPPTLVEVEFETTPPVGAILPAELVTDVLATDTTGPT